MTNLPDIEGVNPAEYWIVDAKGVEWLYLLSKLIKKLPPIAADKTTIPVVILPKFDGSIIYMLHRAFVNSVQLSKLTQLSIEEIKSMESIKLEVTPKDLPEPTVSYWGEA